MYSFIPWGQFSSSSVFFSFFSADRHPRHCCLTLSFAQLTLKSPSVTSHRDQTNTPFLTWSGLHSPKPANPFIVLIVHLPHPPPHSCWQGWTRSTRLRALTPPAIRCLISNRMCSVCSRQALLSQATRFIPHKLFGSAYLSAWIRSDVGMIDDIRKRKYLELSAVRLGGMWRRPTPPLVSSRS